MADLMPASVSQVDPVLTTLNAAQHEAVISPANVLQILAPPGSGKTKTLTSRVAYMLRDLRYKPSNIICLTFTIKSSRELKERIARLVGENGNKLVLGTFHSVCRRYLVAYGHLIGVEKDFGIADSGDSQSIIRRIIKRQKLQVDVKAAQTRISSAKSRGGTLKNGGDKVKDNVEQQEFAIVFELYQQQLETSNLLDYDDLLLRCVDLLQKHPTCVSNVEAVLVDEFQDTNVVQYELLQLFASHRKRVTTVGDPDQSIYGWRSAEVKNLKRMQRQYPDTLVLNLEENYRSSGAILLAAQEVIEQDESRPQKMISPTHCPGTTPVLRLLPLAEIEASWVATEILRIKALTGGMLCYGDFAILLRSASLSRLIEAAMNKAGIPYRMVGGQRFFDRVEVKLLLDYLRVLSQPKNNDALVRVINTPSRGVGAATVKALLEEAEEAKEPLWDVIRRLKGQSAKTKVSKSAEQGLGWFSNLILVTRKKLFDYQLNPEETLQLLIKKLDFQSYLKKTYPDEHESRWANVEELVVQASEFDISEELPVDDIEQESAAEVLSKFLGHVALANEVQTDKDQSPVTVSTIHAAKGLEWPVVFIPCTYEGCIPHSRAEDTDEERRLLYVAMTRAQGLLYMSCPVRSSQKDETKLSTFFSKKVKRHLSNQGPSMDHTDVGDLSRILRRACPSVDDIARSSQGLERRCDDAWPLNGEYQQHLDTRKRKLHAYEDANNTTMNNKAMFTMGGFRTAHVQHVWEKQAPVATPTPVQGTLSSIWGTRNQTAAHKENIPPWVQAAEALLPQGGAENVPAKNALPWGEAAKNASALPEVNSMNVSLWGQTTRNASALPQAELNKVSPGKNEGRPVQTLHKTTMSLLTQCSKTNRRTLGVRRSMVGWGERSKVAQREPGDIPK